MAESEQKDAKGDLEILCRSCGYDLSGYLLDAWSEEGEYCPVTAPF